MVSESNDIHLGTPGFAADTVCCRLQRLAAVPLEMYALLICTEPVAGCLMLRRRLACSCWGLGNAHLPGV